MRRPQPLAARSLLLLPVLALAACGGSGGESSGTPAGDVGNYLPLSVGNRWVYQQDKDIGLGMVLHLSELEKISGTTLVAGREALIHNVASLVSNSHFIEGHLAKTPTALVNVLDPAITPGHLAELQVLRLPLRAGDSYVPQDYTGLASTSDADGDGLLESIDIHVTVDVLPAEAVTVPAGTFSALKVRSQSLYRITYSQDASTFTNTATTVDWYAAGVGRIKTTASSVATWSSTGLTLPDAYTKELTGYKVDGVSTDTSAPTVASHLPAANASVSGDTEISVTFSEDMDPYTLVLTLGGDAPWFTLVDAGGQPVPVTSESYSDRKLTITPQQPLAAGTYTATLVGGTDALGNPLAAPVSWGFTVN